MPTEISEYKGHKFIKLKRTPDDRFPFSFGLKKAQLILDNLDSIKKFVNGEEVNKDLVELGEFKGFKLIKLKRTPDDKYPLSFGLKKAQLIIDNVEAIKEFVSSQ